MGIASCCLLYIKITTDIILCSRGDMDVFFDSLFKNKQSLPYGEDKKEGGVADTTNTTVGAADTGSMPAFDFNSDIEPSGKNGVFTYPVSVPIDGMPLVKLHVTGQIVYKITDQTNYNAFVAKIPQTLYLALKEVFLKGVPGADPQEIPLHEADILYKLRQGTFSPMIETFGIRIVAVKIHNVSTESLMGLFMKAQQQPVIEPWSCPNCGAQNKGRFCEYYGSPKP